MRAMQRRIVLCATATLLAGPLLAAEFWEKKPFDEWNRNEVRRMLTRSPWAQRTTIGLDPLGPGLGTPGLGVPQAGGFPGAGPGGLPPGAATGGSPRAPGPEPIGPGAQDVVVRWHSALPIRQALVRSNASGEGTLSEAARRFLESQTEYYIVSVSGLPAAVVHPLTDPARLAKAAALKLKGRSAVRPEKAEFDAEGGLVGLRFYFCRSHEITLADGEIEFTLDLSEVRFSRKFKLKEMVFQGKLEL
jgi:hypothetical protein